PHRVPEVGECARVALLAEPAIDLHQGTPQSLLRGLALQPCLACAAPALVVGEAEKVEGWQTSSCPECLPGVTFATRQQAGFPYIEPQTEFPQPQRQDP